MFLRGLFVKTGRPCQFFRKAFKKTAKRRQKIAKARQKFAKAWQSFAKVWQKA